MQLDHVSANLCSVYRWCPFQYFLSYVLGIKGTSGKAALIGTIVHKVLQIHALASRRGKRLDEEWVLHWAWDTRAARAPHVEIAKTNRRGQSADFRKVRAHVAAALGNRFYDPRGMQVLSVEQEFRLPMEGVSWTLHGFMDLVHKLDAETIEVVDWKTGAKRDLISGEVLTHEVLRTEVQPRLYHLAATLLYPEYRNVLVTFFYTQDGPVTLTFTPEDLLLTLESIFDFVRVVMNDCTLRQCRSFRCKTLCYYGRSGVCERVWDDLAHFGYEFCVDRHGKGVTRSPHEPDSKTPGGSVRGDVCAAPLP